MKQISSEPSAIRIKVDTVELNVEDWGGDGRPLVFAHPTGFLGAIWRPVIRRLREAGSRAHILTFDQRGHGLSSKPDAGYEWDRFIDDTSRLLRALDVENAIGVGHSSGATTLAGVAAGNPTVLVRLVLVDPILVDVEHRALPHAGGSAMAARTRTRRLVWASRDEIYDSFRSREPYRTWTDEALRAYVDFGTFLRPDGEVELLCPGRIEAQIYENSGSRDAFEDLRALEVPCTLVRGGRSVSFPQARAERALACLRFGRLVTFGEAGHFVPMELPDPIAGLILDECSK
jgi:pimeloyl-ACP methyl ester carboxylesterase